MKSIKNSLNKICTTDDSLFYTVPVSWYIVLSTNCRLMIESECCNCCSVFCHLHVGTILLRIRAFVTKKIRFYVTY